MMLAQNFAENLIKKQKCAARFISVHFLRDALEKKMKNNIKARKKLIIIKTL